MFVFIIYVLTLYKGGVKVHSPKFLINAGLKVKSFTTDQVQAELKGYAKFVVVRHPLKRLLSAYYDKVLGNNYVNKEKIISNFKKSNYKKSGLHSYPLLPEFVSYVVNMRNDRHWIPQEDRCNICNIDYQYILKLETMNEDLPMILDEVYKQGDFQYSRRNSKYSQKSETATKITKSRLDEYTWLDQQLYHDVVKKFTPGIEILGYSYNESGYTANCGNYHSSVGYCC